jgi:hypothetical protein
MGILDGLMGNTGSLIGAGLGLLAGSSNKGSSASQTSNQIDPRVAQYIYGANGSGGLLGDAASVYKQQMGQGGLNDVQRQGLDMRLNYLKSPQYTNSYQAMMDQGMGMMSRGVAGNPFTQARQQQQTAPQATVGYQYTPTQAAPPVARPEAPMASVSSLQSAMPVTGGGSNSVQSGGGGNISTPGGQGISNDMVSAALAAMAASENPTLRMFFPSLAGLLGAGGSHFAGKQADAMGDAGNKLAASQPLANLGIGTTSDSDGNVRTFSSPDSIAAADRAMFGGGDGRDGGYGSYYGSGSIGGW